MKHKDWFCFVWGSYCLVDRKLNSAPLLGNTGTDQYSKEVKTVGRMGGGNPPKDIYKTWQPSLWRITGVQIEKLRMPHPSPVLMMGLVEHGFYHINTSWYHGLVKSLQWLSYLLLFSSQRTRTTTTKRASWWTSIVPIRGLVKIKLTADACTCPGR